MVDRGTRNIAVPRAERTFSGRLLQDQPLLEGTEIHQRCTLKFRLLASNTATRWFTVSAIARLPLLTAKDEGPVGEKSSPELAAEGRTKPSVPSSFFGSSRFGMLRLLVSVG